MKVNSNYITQATDLLVIAVGTLILTGCFFYIFSFKSVLPAILKMTFNCGLCFILSGITLYLPDVLNCTQHRENPNNRILLPNPGCNRPINVFAGKSSGGDSATKLISVTTCALQPILKQCYFA